jgi:hypothetical protein
LFINKRIWRKQLMTHSKNDPLLMVAQGLLVLLTGLIIFAMVMVTIGVAAVLTVQRAEILAKVAAAGAPSELYWILVAALLLVVVLLGFGLRFVIELGRIVASVRTGDPFCPANADRLARMAWLTLGIQVGTWLMILPALQVQPYVNTLPLRVDLQVPPTGLVLALVLFILARVFRYGTALRTDLEGTV